MVLLCAGKWIFRYLGKFYEKSQKIHAPEGNQYQKKGQRGAKGGPGALVARPSSWPRGGGRLGGPHLLCCPTSTHILSRDGEIPGKKLFSQFPSRSRRHPLFFLGRANLEADLASGEGRTSPSSSSSPLHHHSMTPPSMCE